MKRTILLTTVIMTSLLFTHCADQQSNLAAKAEFASTESSASSEEELIRRGEYLVTIMGCHDCHSPKRMGPNGPELIPELMLSGYPGDQPFPEVKASAMPEGWAMLVPDLTAAVGPWGVSFAANITSDETGIGTWTEEQFRKAFTQGKSKGLDGTRPILPPMPWFNFTNIEDGDLKAIFTYLKNTKPVRNAVPNPIPPDQLQ